MPTIAPIAPDVAKPAPSRTERFCVRLDEHLETLAKAKRLPFLLAQRADWLERYGEFIRSVDRGAMPGNGVSAYDYVMTIAEIGRRIQQEGVS